MVNNKRATGVHYMHNDEQHEIGAKREVVLSAGAVQSPQLLMLSGIGPKQHLEKHEVKIGIVCNE